MTVKRHNFYAVIGSGKENQAEIVKIAAKFRNEVNRDLNQRYFRAAVIDHTISTLFQDLKSFSVGGPLTLVRIVPPPANSQLIYTWSSRADGSISVTHEGDTTFVESQKTGASMKLISVFQHNWAAMPKATAQYFSSCHSAPISDGR